MQFIRTEHDGIRIVWKFCLGQYGLGQCNDFYNSEQVTKWNVMALLWSIKGREFFFFNVPYLFLLLTDLRKAKVYARLIEEQKGDLIHFFSSLNQLCRGILSLSSQENCQGLGENLHTQTVLSFWKLQHRAQSLAHSGCSINFYWMNKCGTRGVPFLDRKGSCVAIMSLFSTYLVLGSTDFIRERRWLARPDLSILWD